MARNIDEIIDSLPADRRRRIGERARVLIVEELSLRDLRAACEMTEVENFDDPGVRSREKSSTD